MFDKSPVASEIEYDDMISNVTADRIEFATSAPVIELTKKAGHVVGAQEFCFECPQVDFSLTTGTRVLVAHYDAGAGQRSWQFYWESNTLKFIWSTDGSFQSANLVSGSFTPTSGTPNDLTVERDSSDVLRIYVDGTVLASATVSATFFDATANITIGAALSSGSSTQNFRGFMSGVPRLTIGAHRYGGAHTPASPPWPTSA